MDFLKGTSLFTYRLLVTCTCGKNVFSFLELHFDAHECWICLDFFPNNLNKNTILIQHRTSPKAVSVYSTLHQRCVLTVIFK